MTDKQERNEASFKHIEDELSKIMVILRVENENKIFKKKFATITMELRYALGGIHKKLNPDIGVAGW